MSNDPILTHRINQLESGFSDLKNEDAELKKQVSGVSSDVKLLAKTMSDLTTQITTLVKQNADRDSQKYDEMVDKVKQEGRFSRIELQLKIVAVLATAAAVAIVGTLITALMDVNK